MTGVLESLEQVAGILDEGDIEATFAGGAVLPLLVDAVVGADLRPTYDVDVIVRAGTYFEYQAKCAVLERAGFTSGAVQCDPVCRFRRGTLVVDMMPTPYEGAGTANPWFELGVRTAAEYELPGGRKIRTVAGPVYLATKIAAFRGRGAGDYYGSKDFEDIVALLDGRAELLGECRGQEVQVRRYLSAWAKEFLQERGQRMYLESHISRASGSERWRVVRERIGEIATMQAE